MTEGKIELGKYKLTALEIRIFTNQVVNFRIGALQNTYKDSEYADIRVIVDNIERTYTLEEFLSLLGFAPVVK